MHNFQPYGVVAAHEYFEFIGALNLNNEMHNKVFYISLSG